MITKKCYGLRDFQDSDDDSDDDDDDDWHDTPTTKTTETYTQLLFLDEKDIRAPIQQPLAYPIVQTPALKIQKTITETRTKQTSTDVYHSNKRRCGVVNSVVIQEKRVHHGVVARTTTAAITGTDTLPNNNNVKACCFPPSILPSTTNRQ